MDGEKSLIDGFWAPHREACRFFGVSGSTIRRWANNNQVTYKRNPSNQRVYFLRTSNSSKNDNQLRKQETPLQNFIYCRVSSKKQQDDLKRQVDFLSSKYPTYKVITDIGSGLNYKRRGLLKLLDLSNKKQVGKIIVGSKDRLVRFGFELT